MFLHFLVRDVASQVPLQHPVQEGEGVLPVEVGVDSHLEEEVAVDSHLEEEVEVDSHL